MTSGRAQLCWPVCNRSDSQSRVWARGGVPRWEAGKRRSRPKPGCEESLKNEKAGKATEVL